jgi:aspartyl aminopeptidase
LTHILEEFCDFLKSSPTAFHAAREMGMRLALHDFYPLELDAPFKLKSGGKYFVESGGTFAAFTLPEKAPERLALIGAHTDSPALKLKPKQGKRVHNMEMLGVEVYGGPILHTWLGRDLAISGRIVVDEGSVETHLVHLDEAPVMIPLLAPHLDRELYQKFEINKQDHLQAIAATSEPLEMAYLEQLLRRQIAFKELLGYDLFLVPLEPPRFLGGRGELLSAYRLDNLASCYAALTALGQLDKSDEGVLPMALFWDHEEIGSSTTKGAASPFFADLLERIACHYKMSHEQKAIFKEKSLCLSVDGTHALNPNFEKKYDPEHLPLLGGGVVVKYSAEMRYTTTAMGTARMKKLFKDQDLKMQEFVNRSDNRPGSTIGPIFSTNMGIETVDIGLAQLSMHATREVIHCRDMLDLVELLARFLKEGA